MLPVSSPLSPASPPLLLLLLLLLLPPLRREHQPRLLMLLDLARVAASGYTFFFIARGRGVIWEGLANGGGLCARLPLVPRAARETVSLHSSGGVATWH